MVNRCIFLLRIITAFLLLLQPQHWLVERAAWRITLTLVSISDFHTCFCSWFDWFLDLRCDICVNLLTFSLPELLGDLSKFGRGDASSPAPATTLAQTQQNQSQTHHTTQQAFLNPALPPGYSYTSLPYYTGMPGLPNTFQYGPAVFPVRILSSVQASFFTVCLPP